MELNFFSAYALTIATETLILYFILRKDYRTGTIVRNSVIASTLTLPFVWFFFPLFPVGYAVRIGISELFAFAAEAGVYAILFEKIGWKKAAAISFAANAISFSAGIAVSML